MIVLSWCDDDVVRLQCSPSIDRSTHTYYQRFNRHHDNCHTHFPAPVLVPDSHVWSARRGGTSVLGGQDQRRRGLGREERLLGVVLVRHARGLILLGALLAARARSLGLNHGGALDHPRALGLSAALLLLGLRLVGATTYFAHHCQSQLVTAR
jgi:hypothetical protein